MSRKLITYILLLTLALGSFITSLEVFAGGYSAFGPRLYLRENGSPVTEVDTFYSIVTGAFTLHISNGGLKDDIYELVSSSEIYLNGVRVLGPNELNQNVTYIEKSVILQSFNEISVEVRGKPGGALVINIVGDDSTLPVINASISPLANSNGWNSSDPTVTFACSDDESGIASCSSPVILSSEGDGQIVTGTAVDVAGNMASSSVTINLDKSQPTLAITSPLNGITVGDPIINITGQATDTVSQVSLTVGGSLVALDANGDFSQAISLVEGINAIPVIATDEADNASTQTIDIILESNQAPIGDSQLVVTTEDSVSNILLTGSDADGDVLTFHIITQTTNGAITGTVPNISYQPNANYNGTDSFTFLVNDGAVNSAVATVDITINAINDAPVANAQTVTTNEDTSLAIVLTGSDIDGDVLTYQVVSQPTQGTLTGVAPNLTYQPNADYNGADSFTFRVNDGTGDSAEAIVNLTVISVNDVPVANNLTITSNEDTSVVINLSGSDVDDDTLFFQVLTQPSKGVISGIAPNLTYSPNSNSNGIDSFTYKVNDGGLDSQPASVTITVSAVNDEPGLAIVSLISGAEFATGESISFVATAIDIEDGDIATNISWEANPGSINLGVGNSINASFLSGTFTVTATIVDSGNISVSQSINLSIIDANKPPVVTSIPYTMTKVNAAYAYAVTVTDENVNDVITFSLLSAPNGMAIDSATGVVSWVAQQIDLGTHFVSVQIDDGQGGIISHEYSLVVVEETIDDAAHLGTDFWIPRLPAVLNNRLYITSTTDTTGVIDVLGGIGAGQIPFSVKANQITMVELSPVRATQIHKPDTASNGVRNWAVNVTSEAPISITVIYYRPAQTEGLLAFPARSFGTEYFLTSMGALAILNQPPRSTIIATEDNTTVTVTPTTPLEVDGVMIQAGQTAQFTINRGEDYHLRSTRDDLSGTSIVSNKPVAVFSGHGCSYVQGEFCNRLTEQMLPTNLWQKRYITTPLKSRVGDFFRVFASVDNTQVMVNGVLDSVINRGEFTTIELIEASEITANNHIQVVQHSTSWSYDRLKKRDEFYIDISDEILNRSASWSSDYVIELDPAPAENYVFVIIEDSAKDSLQVDGITVDPRSFGRVPSFVWLPRNERPDPIYTTAQIAISPGTHQISASIPFGLLKNINAVERYADPAMAVVQPEQSYLKAYSFQTPDTGGLSRNFINITVPQTGIASVTLDGLLIDHAHFTPITNTGFAVARLGVNIGPHYIYADEAFGLQVYGFDDRDAYMYPGGWAFNQSQVVSSLIVQADNVIPTVTDEVCITATALDAANSPVAFARIDLQVAGIHDTQLSLIADSNGVTRHCYQGIYVGADQINVYADAGSASLDINWVLGASNHAPVIISKPILLVQDAQAYSYSVKAIDADNDQLTYSLMNPPAGMTIDSISGVISWAATAGQYAIDVMVSDTATNNTQQQYTLIVNRTPILVDLPKTTILSQQTYTSRLGASDPDGDTLYYRLTQGSGQFSVNSRTGQINSADLMALGSYPITIEVSDHKGGAWSYSYTLLVDGVNVAPTLTTPVTSFSIIAGEVVTFDLTASDANGDSVVINVTAGQLPGLAINPSTGHVVWTSDNAVVGNHQVTVVAIDAWGATSNSVTLDFSVAENLPPQITSTPPGAAYVGQLFEYPITFNDPENRPVDVTLVWAGLTVSSINSNNVLSWMPAAHDLGRTITMQIRVTDDIGQSHDQVFSYLVRNVNTAPPSLISGLPYQAFVDIPLTHQLQAEDPDSDPIEFSKISGPTGLTISSAGLIEWTPLLTQTGDQPVTVRISDGELFQDYSWAINTLLTPLPLEANIIVDPIFIAPGETTLLTVQALGGISPSIDSVTVDGVAITLVNEQATLSSSIVGRHDIVVAISDQGESSSFTAYFTVTDPSDTSHPVVTIESPLAGEQITTNTPIVVSASDDNLVDVELLVRKRGSEESTELYRGSVSLASQTIAEFDPTLLRNGLYELVLRATDANGLIQFTTNPVVVTGGKKVGNFSITLQDLNIPLAGIPITVSRTYDSRRRNEKLDFGYGWSIDYQNVTVEEASEPTTNWTRSLESQIFKINGIPINFQGTCMRAGEDKTVTVTLPNDEVEVFTVRLRGITGSQIADSDPDCDLTPSSNFDLYFDPDEDTYSALEAYADSNLFLSGGGHLVADIIEEQPVNVTKYRLTTRFGFIYNLDQDFGIESVIDPSGNSLTYSDTGIVHSSGKSVSFNRNIDGLITSITDPNGNVIDYQYNSNTDLVTSTDALINSTVYRYDNTHGLVDIEDPLGRNLIRNFYDNDGRLISQQDTDGNVTNFSHDLAGNTSIVTNRRGYSTQFQYDDRGNVLTEIDALGNLTSYTYDASDNQLSRTNALNHASTATYSDQDDQLTQVDELGNTTSFTYNDRGQELNITDAKGNAYQNTYDIAGNLISIDGPDGSNLGTNVISFRGFVIQVADTFGQTTGYTYDNDGFGYKTSETNALGHVTTWTNDGNGNVLTETTQRTVNGILVDETTTFEYDSLDKLIRTTDALGNITQQVYDQIGNKIQDIDAFGRITTYTYDPYRRLTRTDYPDGSFTTSTYDVEGNLTSETDANGNITSFTYDALDRLINTTYADGSSTSSEYDAVGRVISETDERGNITTYQYDAAGQRIQTTNALLQTITSSYDANGNLATITDAKGNITTYEYDVYDNRINTIWPDASISSEDYDAKSRLTGKTDQNGNTISFGYDAVDRLIAVTDALNNVTSYGYDEVGNKLTQTDANLNATSWTFDALGRELTRTLPLVQIESSQYDSVGNRSQMTDFNGQITTYGYDSRDRLSSVTYNDSSTELFGYDSNGNRTSAINRDNSGQSWAYDSRNRLSQVIDGAGNQLDYGYDLSGNKAQLSTTPVDTGTGKVTGYSYDVLNRLQTVTDNNNSVTNYSYDENGNRASVAYPNGNSTSYVYDANNRLIQQTTVDANNIQIADYQYTLDPSGHRLSITEPNRTTTYNYDASYKLLSEDITDPVNGNHNASYEYDAVGNRTYSTINGVQTLYSYDANDRLTQQGGEVFGYDGNGNTISKTIDGEVSTFAYDAKNQFDNATLLEGGITTTTSYQYDIDGIRIQKSDDGNTADYLIDPNRDYAQVLRKTNQTTLDSVDYLYGDDLIGQSRPSNGYSYYLYDGLGSTRKLTNSLGSITDSYDYDAFGTELNRTGNTDNNYLFAGEQFDSALDNYYLRARYYDPGTARFTQQDTWMGDNQDPITLHKYMYAGANPVSYVDPSGNNFSLGGLSASINIQGTLAATATANFSRAIGQVGVGLVAGGLGYGLSEDLKDFIAANAPAMNEILEEKRTFARDAVEEKARGRNALYHYSSRGAVLSIAASGVGYSSPGFGRGRPPGFYASSITPWSIQHTQEDLSAIFYGGNTNRDVSWFVAIDGQSFLKHPGNSSEYFSPSNTGYTDLNVISVGPNLMLPR